eukprot:3917889-Pleurochrysis_carterae.AAC.1
MEALAFSRLSTIARRQLDETSICQRPRCLMSVRPSSSKRSAISIAPPIPQHLPPNSVGSRPALAVISLADARECFVVHGVSHPVRCAAVKNGVSLRRPK